MHAVIKTGGKQYKVAEGDTVRVEKLSQELGADIEITDVLMIIDGDAVQVGAPYVAGAKVSAKILEHGRGRKIQVVKFKRRKQHLKRMGHRQSFTKLQITAIAKAD